MKKCKTCKFWKPIGASYYKMEKHYCGQSTVLDYNNTGLDLLIRTGPEFGCRNHQKQD